MSWQQTKNAKAEAVQSALHAIASAPNIAQAVCVVIHGKIDESHQTMEEAQDNMALWKEQGKLLVLRELLRAIEIQR